MALNHIYKFADMQEMQHFLNGAIVGVDITRGISGLVGLVLTFTSPAFAVTFVPISPPSTTRDSYALQLKDIKAQVEAANANILVLQFGGRIVFAERVPTNGVALSANSEDAKALLGFDKNAAVAGHLYRPFGITGGPPNFVMAYSISETSHVLLTWE